MLLEELVQANVLENNDQECKARLNRQDIVGWMKTIAGFANADGGRMYIGVEDKTGKLIGFDRIEADNERNYLNNQINEHLYPHPNYTINFIPYVIHEKQRYIIELIVSQSDIKPVIFKINGIPAIYMRRNGFTNAATYEEIRKMSLESTHLQYDMLPSKIEYKPDDFMMLRAFCQNHGGKALTEKFFLEIGFIAKDMQLRNGAVLFMDDYKGEKTTVQCSVFSGFTKGSERIVSINKYKGNLTNSINYMREFVETRMNHSVLKLDDRRVDIDAYPTRALFEGIINAVVHRDYFLDGTQIQIDMFRDRLEISSPGSFYEGAPLGRTQNLSSIISKRRNELICNVFVRCNVMEAAGTGFDKIIEEYSGADERHKPYVISTSDHFTLVLPDLTYAEGTSIAVTPDKLAYVPIPNGTRHDGRVLAYCYNMARKSSEIASYLGITDSTYFRKNTLANLVKTGYLTSEKAGRAIYYKTSKAHVKLN